MRKKALGGGLALLLVGLSVAAAAPRDDIYNDDPPKAASKQQGGAWTNFRRWFGPADKKPAAPDKTSAKKTDATPPKTVVAPKKTDPSVVRQREQVDLDRRRSVVIRLLEIAMETNDAELQRMADQLDERAWMLYMQRTAHLPASKTIFENDEKILDKHLKPDNFTGKTVRPAVGGDRDQGSRAAVGEDRR